MNRTPDKLSVKSIYCRICHEDGDCEELIDPCECSGTVRMIHASCLEKWLSASNSTHCEICKYAFTVKKKNKPLAQSLLQWWVTKSGYGPQGIGGDLICLAVLTPLCFAAVYLCSIGATDYIRNGLIEGTGLAALCFMVVATYLLWFVVTLRFHFNSWKDWCLHNQDVQLLVKHRVLKMKNLSIVSNNNNNNFHNNRDFIRSHNLRSPPQQFLRIISADPTLIYNIHGTWV